MSLLPVPASLNFSLQESRLIWVQDRLLEKSWKTNAVTVEDIPVWLVRKGKLALEMGGERMEATEGHWMFPRQGQGRVHTLPQSKILSFRFRLRWPNGREVYRRNRSLVLPGTKSPELMKATQALLRQLEHPVYWYGDQWTPRSSADYFSVQAAFHRWLAAYGRVMELFGQGENLSRQEEEPALQTRRVLMEWSLAAPFSRKLLSRRLGVSVQTVSRGFIAQYGTTPREFLEQRKLQWAQERLTLSTERIKAVAAELGFSNLARFSNWFRCRNQMSPRAYRLFTRPGK